ncbi:hypothetical protein BGZ76_010724 [Entomortierella beljakovae]|nr:hypothetical protein BGZ76_010724 [Entomortierella beljakovae]
MSYFSTNRCISAFTSSPSSKPPKSLSSSFSLSKDIKKRQQKQNNEKKESVNIWVKTACRLLGITSELHRIKDAMLPILTPAEIAVAILYWSLTLSNVYHIYPDGNRYIPLWIDLQVHGIPCIFVALEMFYFSETFKVRRFTDFCAVISFALFYLSWSSLCAHKDGEWPYPILQNIVCPWERLYFMSTGIVGYVILHFVISEAHIRSKASKTLEQIAERAKDL